ncbi:hypothetical protein ACFCVO_14065 [Agromyces sp. NPDC056379]|uniref:hypothetical protein n=1 Tax=unclassified Agromyces TaxID=2639701 RepID=UPI0035E2EF61
MTADRVADLERIVYGSGASDEEREQSARELLELRAALAAAEERTDEAGTTAETADVEAADADSAPAPHTDDPVAAADPRRRLRRVIIAATAALVIGVLAGWQLGAREAEQRAELASAAGSAFPGPRTQAEYLAALPPAADSPATEVFDRPATAADAPEASWMPDVGGAGADSRLLAIRGDGTSIYAVHDGDEYCVYVVLPVLEAGTISCTEGGRFPAEGLQAGMSVEGSPEATVGVTWRPDGSLSVLVPRTEPATLPLDENPGPR